MQFEARESLDPAVVVHDHPPSCALSSSWPAERTGIFAFDFDGVIAGPEEDRLYRAAIRPGEEHETDAAAQALGLRCAGMEYRYQRHLVYQAALWRLGVPIPVGPALRQAQEVSLAGRLFILTARSGWFAVERFRAFLAAHNIVPLETFHVGRVGKVAQIRLLCREFPNQTINFVEDSWPHLNQVMQAQVGDVHPIHIENEPGTELDEKGIPAQYTETLQNVLLAMNGRFDPNA